MSGHDETIPVVEETAFVDKREIETGKVKVHTVVENSEQIVREALSARNVKVTRVPVDQVVTTIQKSAPRTASRLFRCWRKFL
jgi:hypothetical protein